MSSQSLKINSNSTDSQEVNEFKINNQQEDESPHLLIETVQTLVFNNDPVKVNQGLKIIRNATYKSRKNGSKLINSSILARLFQLSRSNMPELIKSNIALVLSKLTISDYKFFRFLISAGISDIFVQNISSKDKNIKKKIYSLRAILKISERDTSSQKLFCKKKVYQRIIILMQQVQTWTDISKFKQWLVVYWSAYTLRSILTGKSTKIDPEFLQQKQYHQRFVETCCNKFLKSLESFQQPLYIFLQLIGRITFKINSDELFTVIEETGLLNKFAELFLCQQQKSKDYRDPYRIIWISKFLLQISKKSEIYLESLFSDQNSDLIAILCRKFKDRDQDLNLRSVLCQLLIQPLKLSNREDQSKWNIVGIEFYRQNKFMDVFFEGILECSNASFVLSCMKGVSSLLKSSKREQKSEHSKELQQLKSNEGYLVMNKLLVKYSQGGSCLKGHLQLIIEDIQESCLYK